MKPLLARVALLLAVLNLGAVATGNRGHINATVSEEIVSQIGENKNTYDPNVHDRIERLLTE